MSVGNDHKKSKPLSFCTNASMKEPQLRPCALIPDSGTTAILGKAEDINELLTTICDEWDRCRKNYTTMVKAAKAAKKVAKEMYGTDVFEIEKSMPTKRKMLELILGDCNDWLMEGNGLYDLPSVHF